MPSAIVQAAQFTQPRIARVAPKSYDRPFHLLSMSVDGTRTVRIQLLLHTSPDEATKGLRIAFTLHHVRNTMILIWPR